MTNKKVPPPLKVNVSNTSNAPSNSQIEAELLLLTESHPANVSSSTSSKSSVTLSNTLLQPIAEIGSGSGGTVFLCRHKESGKILARKMLTLVFDTEAEPADPVNRIMRELKIQRKCRSEYIVQFYGAFTFEGEISICMEYMDMGSLDNVYKAIGSLPESIISLITGPVIRGLVYLFDSHKIVHRDIKPSNILLNRKGEVKIADFGVAKELINGTYARTFTGTEGYLAPERINGECEHGVESDVWSLGIALMELALGRFPLPPSGVAFVAPLELLNYIQCEPSPTLPDGFSENFNMFVNKCLTKDRSNRPKPAMLLDHPFVVNVPLHQHFVDWCVLIFPKMNRPVY